MTNNLSNLLDSLLSKHKECPDRIVLELAAKASGVVIRIDEPWNNNDLPYFHTAKGLWRPLYDDGDAHRLSIELQLNIIHEAFTVEVSRFLIPSVKHIEQITMNYSRAEATRRAITLAAAAIQIAREAQP